jgi:hypothetical protein
VKLVCSHDHYFIDEEVPISPYFIEHYDEIMGLKPSDAANNVRIGSAAVMAKGNWS